MVSQLRLRGTGGTLICGFILLGVVLLGGCAPAHSHCIRKERQEKQSAYCCRKKTLRSGEAICEETCLRTKTRQATSLPRRD